MGRSNRFVKPEVKRIPLTDDDWIEVKKGLDVGDLRIMENLGSTPTIVEGNIVDRVDWNLYDLLLADLWVTDWSFSIEDKDGKIVPVKKSLSAIKALEPEDFNEIIEAVRGHMTEWLNAKKEKRSSERTPLDTEKSSLISQ